MLTAISVGVFLLWLAAGAGIIYGAGVIYCCIPLIVVVFACKIGYDRLGAPVWWVVISTLVGVAGMIFSAVFVTEFGYRMLLPTLGSVIYAVVSLALFYKKSGSAEPLREIVLQKKKQDEPVEDYEQSGAPKGYSVEISVDLGVFSKYGLRFRCNPVEENGALQLNFEILNDLEPEAAYPKGEDLWVSAHAYDKGHNLLYIEETWVEYKNLMHGRAADYFLFMGDNVERVVEIQVYAEDPACEL